ncbi:hypothetical protein [Leucobacter sp. M11]|uniref:hypothetical protein n=1 Tax=Leucobacter sp. M11 TaxID=2993565 RepID=UPI002D8081CE|nr:hypothetical protein [Leucobacter sp. M11]MEB4616221.1 hypothetical protein [Leucobacter sp. M11]
MRKFFTLIFGVALGFVAAHFINSTPEGRRFFQRVDRSVKQFGDAVVSGYRSGESELEDTLDDVERALKRLAPKQ